MATARRDDNEVRALRSQAWWLVPAGVDLPRRVERSGKATTDSDVVEARYIEIVPDVRVVHAVDFESDDPAFAGTMTMTREVAATDRCTRVEITADDVRDGISAENHAAGLASTLANLAEYVER